MPRVEVQVTGDGSGAAAALGQVETRAGRFNSAMAKANQAAKVVGVGLLALGAGAFKAASDAQQAAGAVEAVFGTYATQVQAQADQAAQNVGLAKGQYGQLAATLGAQLKNMGVSQDQLAGQTEGMIGLASDLAAQFGGDTSEAVAALSSLMRGERDPIEKYGVSIKEADIAAQKAKMGLSGLTGEADKQATTQATLALLTQQTASAQGAFAREASTAAGAQQRAQAAIIDAGAALGEVLLPVVAAAAAGLQGFGQWAQQNTGVVQGLAVAVGVIAAAIMGYNLVVSALPAIQAAATAAQWLWNAAMAANPVVWVVVAIIALIAIVVLLVKHWDAVKAVALNVWAAISAGAGQVASAVAGFFGRIWSRVSAIASQIGGAFAAAWQRVTAAARTVQTVVSAGMAIVGSKVRDIANTVRGVLVGAWNAAKAAAANFVSGITGGIQGVIGWVNSLLEKVRGIASAVANAVGGLFKFNAADPEPGAPGWRPPGPPGTPGWTFAAGDPTPALLGRLASGVAVQNVTEVHITVTGALDPHGVARQIRDLLNSDAQRTGRVAINRTVV